MPRSHLSTFLSPVPLRHKNSAMGGQRHPLTQRGARTPLGVRCGTASSACPGACRSWQTCTCSHALTRAHIRLAHRRRRYSGTREHTHTHTFTDAHTHRHSGTRVTQTHTPGQKCTLTNIDGRSNRDRVRFFHGGEVGSSTRTLSFSLTPSPSAWARRREPPPL